MPLAAPHKTPQTTPKYYRSRPSAEDHDESQQAAFDDDNDFSPSREAIESPIEDEIAALQAQLDDVHADQHAADPPSAAAAQGGGTPHGNAGTEGGDEEATGVDEEAAGVDEGAAGEPSSSGSAKKKRKKAAPQRSRPRSSARTSSPGSRAATACAWSGLSMVVVMMACSPRPLASSRSTSR